jgi:hypothetical protein
VSEAGVLAKSQASIITRVPGPPFPRGKRDET